MNFNRETYGSQPEQQLYIFEPQNDITAYEIAQLLPVIIAAAGKKPDIYQVAQNREIPIDLNGIVEKLPQELHRHFKLKQRG